MYLTVLGRELFLIIYIDHLAQWLAHSKNNNNINSITAEKVKGTTVDTVHYILWEEKFWDSN